LPHDDTTLVRRSARGDLDAFGLLVERYQRAVYAVCCDRLRDPHAARDCAQETFLRALDKLHTLREPGAFPGWLRRIADRLALTWLRRESRRPDRAALPLDLAAPEQTAHADDGAIRRAVARLPERWRLPLRLRYQEGLSYAEIARFLGCTASAVGVRLHRARRALRRALAEAHA